MENDDDWGLSAEALDSLERDALKKIAERQQAQSPSPNSKGRPLKKLFVKIFRHSPGQIAVEAPYHTLSLHCASTVAKRSHRRYLEKLLAALKSVGGGEWDKSNKLWIYPESTLKNLEAALYPLENILSRVQIFHPLTSHRDFAEGQRTVGSAEEMPLRQLSGCDGSSIPEDYRSKDAPKLHIRLSLHASADIAAKFDFHRLLVDAMRMIPKASWHAKERLWMFPASSLLCAEKILNQIHDVSLEVQKLDPLVCRALDAAVSVQDLQYLYDRIPQYVESRLLPFQRKGVRFILQHGGRALLADEMGLGKTLQAIAVTSCVEDSWPVLVLTPSSLRLLWANMIHQWLKIPQSEIVVVLSQWSGSNKGGFRIIQSGSMNILLDGAFNIVSYDIVPKLQNMLLESEFKVVIADESHFLKNAQAKRTISSLPVLQKARFSILLSGTPALSRPIELFKQLQALYPGVYKNVHEYGNRYCKGSVFGMYQGASNHEELHNLMKATMMIRRRKSDVLSELPVKRRQQVFLDLDEKDIKQVRALFQELELIKNKINFSTSDEEIQSLKFSQKQLINKIYNVSCDAKIPAVLDYLGTIIEAGCKFLIFAHHQPMINSIHQFLLKKKVGCIRIDGETPQSMRQALVDNFQEQDDIKAAVLSIKAGGVGLTLTAASTVIFAELSWTPGDIIQAEDRAHRIGQVSSVNVYYLLANDTVDDIIWDVIQGKLDNLGQVLDGCENSLTVPSLSQPKSSPSKQVSLSVSSGQPKRSPSKQSSLDSFLKRCPASSGSGGSMPSTPKKARN